jgi:CDP-2,3-bis-(O-geranylgeranyl)-sn-glycerol synthase
MPYDLIFLYIIYPVIFILPAWVANGAPVIFGGGKPVDLGRKVGGKPIFGRHKTIRGLAAGLLSGFLVAGAISLFQPELLFTGIALTVGTHFGDLLGSFVKRRLNKKEGASWAVFDQYLFLVFALLFALPFAFSTRLSLPGVLVIIVLTGVLHKATNIMAHRARMKEVPW